MYSVGSTNSSDIFIKYYDNKENNITVHNLIPEIEDSLIVDVIKKIQNRYNKKMNINVFYNGANTWVIESRIEALIEKINNNIKEEGDNEK